MRSLRSFHLVLVLFLGVLVLQAVRALAVPSPDERPLAGTNPAVVLDEAPVHR